MHSLPLHNDKNTQQIDSSNESEAAIVNAWISLSCNVPLCSQLEIHELIDIKKSKSIQLRQHIEDDLRSDPLLVVKADDPEHFFLRF